MSSSTNWYDVLGVSPTANKKEINKAYRRLAHQFHPDKNPKSENAAEQFQLIKKAYNILSDEALKASFDKQFPFIESKPYHSINNVEDLIVAVRKLNKDTSLQNIFFIDRDILLFQLIELLSPTNLQLLQTNSNGKYLELMLKEQFIIAKILPYKMSKPIFEKWLSSTENNPILKNHVESYIKKKRIVNMIEKAKPLIAVLISIIIMTLIYLSNR
ncbi:MAG: J domain-containing protein [Sediminibacterium sp.]|nr:J domain-containing protein [Sediminibacterium sp.]